MIRSARVALKLSLLGLLAFPAVLAPGCASNSTKEPYTTINTREVINDLSSSPWERHVGSQDQFREWIAFRPDGAGRMQRSDFAPVADFTYRVDAHKLLLEYYIEIDRPGNWRTRAIPYEYRIEGDTLILKHRGNVETWKRVKTRAGG